MTDETTRPGKHRITLEELERWQANAGRLITPQVPDDHVIVEDEHGPAAFGPDGSEVRSFNGGTAIDADQLADFLAETGMSGLEFRERFPDVPVLPTPKITKEGS